MAIARDPETVSLSSQLTYVEHFCMSSSQSSSLVAQLLKNLPATQETPVRLLGWEDPLEQGQAPVFLGFPGGSAGQESICNVGDWGSIPGLGRAPREDLPLEKISWRRASWRTAAHSSILAWRIPWTVQSLWWQRVRHD